MFSSKLIIIFSLLINCLLLQFLHLVNGLHIDIKRKYFVRLNNGIEINENRLIDYLEEHERQLIFGKRKSKTDVKLVHLTQQYNDENDVNLEDDENHIHLRRNKRSTKSIVRHQHQTNGNSSRWKKEISVRIQDDNQLMDVKLHQTPKLIDDAFILIRRFSNTSQFIEDSHQLAEEYERCFYQNENSALDLCDGENVRGIFRNNSTEFLIHPLPERFGKSSHIIVQSESSDEMLQWEKLVSNLQFEPEKDNFNGNTVPPEIRDARKSNYSQRLQRQQQSNHRLRLRSHHVSKKNHRHRRHIATNGKWKIPQVLHVETAIFVDRDLLKHMVKNYPKNTESHLIRFVLAMINGVQLLYNHPSLGRRINFVLKRLEILYTDPQGLGRSSDIDMYLNNFCIWQKSLNPPSDSDAVHYDHAVILTGLDLYVVGKNGKVSSQVVGLAPVAGMCTSTSSCTINEGKHFESVFVVAHEIGHNLGMRHDTSENNCDPSLFIMSPTLGSGKITWSKCSQTYLNSFLETSQAKCLFDRGQFGNKLDHAAEGILPGERFDADQQCMLKYGKDSIRSRNQVISDICRDLHCQRDRYTWTSHPALEGTGCGEMMWCRSGVCVMKASFMEAHSSTRQVNVLPKIGYDKANFAEVPKLGHLLHEFKTPTWNQWGDVSECDSGCLYGASKRLREGSTGLRTYTRSCSDYRRRCQGRDRKYESCIAKQCYSIAITTIEQFATQVCERAQKFDSELTGAGKQIVGDLEESCKVFCKTKTGGTKSRSWTFPDGTTCRSNVHNFDDTSYCIGGRCEKFSCDNSTENYYKIDSIFCPHGDDTERRRLWYHRYSTTANNDENDNDLHHFRGPTTVRSKFENEVALRNIHGTNDDSQNAIRRKSDSYQKNWKYYSYDLSEQSVQTSAPTQIKWIVKSGCHSSCMAKSKGVQVVVSRENGENNIQLCSHNIKPCDHLQSENDYATNTCARYKLKVRGLSGHGAQISASVHDPDRSCRVACQDEFLKHRYYIVNGKYGHFPLGTKCSTADERYCVNGKCLEFGSDNIPLQQSHISLALFRSKRSFSNTNNEHRKKRSYLYYTPINVTETITQDFLNNIIDSLTTSYDPSDSFDEETISNDQIEFANPIHI